MRKIFDARVTKLLPDLSVPAGQLAEITINGADQLYREIRVPNLFTDEQGRQFKLQIGDELNLVIEVHPKRHSQFA